MQLLHCAVFVLSLCLVSSREYNFNVKVKALSFLYDLTKSINNNFDRRLSLIAFLDSQ